MKIQSLSENDLMKLITQAVQAPWWGSIAGLGGLVVGIVVLYFGSAQNALLPKDLGRCPRLTCCGPLGRIAVFQWAFKSSWACVVCHTSR